MYNIINEEFCMITIVAWIRAFIDIVAAYSRHDVGSRLARMFRLSSIVGLSRNGERTHGCSPYINGCQGQV